MAQTRLDFFTPTVGRFVNGSITEKRTKDKDNRPIEEAKQRFEFGVAFPKAELWPLLTEQFFPFLSTELARNPAVATRMQGWFSTFSGFSMKIADGDAPNADGKHNENTRGCFVMYFSSSFAPKAVGNDPAFTEIDPSTIKRGWYVQVAGNIAWNELTDNNAGVYLNGNIMRLVAEGDEIRGGIDAASAFGGAAAPTALPPGAKPLGSTSGVAGVFTPAPAPQQYAPAPAPMAPQHYAPAPAPMAPALPGVPVGAPAAPQTALPGNTPAPYPQILAPTLPPLPGA